MTILSDFLSGDPHKIWEASCAVRRLRDKQELKILADHIHQIRQATSNVELGGGLFPNKDHLAFAIKKLAYVKSGRGCYCELYPSDLLIDPSDEEEHGSVKIIKKQSDTKTWSANYVCECLNCGNTFNVEQGEYHYTWFKWVKRSQRFSTSFLRRFLTFRK